MRLRNTLILLIALALLGAFVYFMELRGQKTSSEEPPIMNFTVSDVVRFEVEKRGGQRMVATRQGQSEWSMEEPYQAEGDSARLESALRQLSTGRPRRVLTETAASLAPFGLDNPQFTVEVELQDGSKRSLEIGDRTPTQTFHYARRDGERAVLLIGSAMVEQLNRLVTEPPEKPTPVPTPTSETRSSAFKCEGRGVHAGAIRYLVAS